MLCWDWCLESRSQKQFAGGWAARERSTSLNTHIALPPCNPPARGISSAALPPMISMIAEERTGAMSSPRQTLVLYDGVCGLCNRLVSFLLRHDRRDQFRFAPLQSELAQTLLRRYCLDSNDFDTVVVLADFGQPAERALTRSQAALWAVSQLGGIWKLFAIAKLAPLFLRERLYRFIAHRRYRVFGKYDQCPLPKAEDRHKFLSVPPVTN